MDLTYLEETVRKLQTRVEELEHQLSRLAASTNTIEIVLGQGSAQTQIQGYQLMVEAPRWNDYEYPGAEDLYALVSLLITVFKKSTPAVATLILHTTLVTRNILSPERAVQFLTEQQQVQWRRDHTALIELLSNNRSRLSSKVVVKVENEELEYLIIPRT